ncbi:MAG: hypothetical protein DWQ34_17330 [Planctomycetota bacterium]|nr:MAG: hypothetical protein DWQ34_17330 [Planctomycetota bacterium]
MMMNRRTHRLNHMAIAAVACCLFAVWQIIAVAPAEEPRSQPDTTKSFATEPLDNVEIQGRSVRIAASDVPGELVITPEGAANPLRVALPEDAGEITELSADTWLRDGIVIAVEATREKEGDASERSYHWVTLDADPEQEGALKLKATAQFHRGPTDYHLVGVRSDDWSDLICVYLADLNTLGDHKPAGLMFVHGCPIAPVAGKLYDMTGTLR